MKALFILFVLVGAGIGGYVWVTQKGSCAQFEAACANSGLNLGRAMACGMLSWQLVGDQRTEARCAEMLAELQKY
jgi:hypothetical protein